MPGIVGLITKMPGKVARQQLASMLETMCHEDFYQNGTWIDESFGVYVGWTARRGSFSDAMPLVNEREDRVLIFSGEEYPEPGTIQRLKERGHTLGAGGPAYLVHQYEEGESSFPAALNGRFHGLAIDRTQGTAALFNDRYGIHRIYYHESKDGLYFAAEAKAILRVRPELRQADPRGLGELVACGCVLENRSLFRDIYILPPGSNWVFRNGDLERKASYFRPQDWESQDCLDAESYYRELRETFARILPRYFDGSERIGMSLTGGLDTRMIMAWHKPTPGSLPCYSFGGMFRDCQDVVLARQVAKACGQAFSVIPVGKEFLSRFSKYAERTVYLSDGCASVKNAPDLYLNRQAAEIAPVRMTGNYGGEVLRRLIAFQPKMPLQGLFHSDFFPQFRLAQQTYNTVLSCDALSFVAFRQTPWHHYGLLGLEQTQLMVRSPYLDNELVRTSFRAPKSTVATTNIFEDSHDCVQLIFDGNSALKRIRTDRGLAGTGGIPSMVSRNWLEFTFKAEYAYDYGMPQWLARTDHAISALHLERIFLGRHKFSHFRLWYRESLSRYVQEMLLDARTLSRPYLKRDAVENIVRSHIRGTRNYTTEIHTLLTLELLHRLFVDAN